MRLNDDQTTVRAMDILFPGIGEMVGGSQREERLDVFRTKNQSTWYSTRRPELVFGFTKIWNCRALWFWSRI